MASSLPLTILVHEWVTGGGLAGEPCPASWAAEGRAMRRAIAADFAAVPGGKSLVVATLDTRWDDDPGPWMIAPIGPGEYPGRLLDLARRADYTVLIAPETTGILAGLTRGLERAGARLLGSSPEAVELTGDKARLAEWFGAHGIASPRTETIVPSQGLPEDFKYPAVLKPIDGAGSIDTYFLADAIDLPEAARGMAKALLQPYLEGMPMSASFLVDRAGTAELIGIGRQRIAIEEGRFRYLGGTLPASCPLAEPLLRKTVKSISGLRGFFGVDFVWDPSRSEATVLEINPRPTTSVVGLCKLLPAGFLARAWLESCGEPEGASDIRIIPEFLEGMRPVTFDSTGEFRSDERLDEA
jgi:predicted ATP-grasp superfamily ATP-dependent carboligase